MNGSAYYALSTASGGYAVPVPMDGTFNVTFSGGGFSTFNTTATVTGGKNVKVDYLALAMPLLLGDYNQNNVVDAADYVVWRDRMGTPGATLPNDDTNGVGLDDYTRWRSSFGKTLAGGTGSVIARVPEPTAGGMLLVMAIVMAHWRLPHRHILR